jgi:hypothetical protein
MQATDLSILRCSPIAAELCRHFNIGKPLATVAQLIERLAILVDQVNVITLPGIVAGYLSGRVESYSMTWYDFTRLHEGFSRISAHMRLRRRVALPRSPNLVASRSCPQRSVPLLTLARLQAENC